MYMTDWETIKRLSGKFYASDFVRDTLVESVHSESWCTLVVTVVTRREKCFKRHLEDRDRSPLYSSRCRWKDKCSIEVRIVRFANNLQVANDK